MSVPHGGIAAMTTERHTPPHIADARTMLENWLDFHRATLTPKAEGLAPEQLCTAWAPPSTLTLQGLMHHMADVNATGSAVCWPRRNCRGSTALTTAPSTSPPTCRSPTHARRGKRRSPSRGRTARNTRSTTRDRSRTEARCPCGGSTNHMITEYARHCGHADLIRERIDGTTGV
jgi:hypothetical protein